MLENQTNFADYDSLFNPTIEVGQTVSSKDEYPASAEKGQNKVFKSVIRFVTWWENPSKSVLEKWVSYLIDPVTQKGRYVDCPSSIGKPSPLQDIYWKLKKNESVQKQKLADVFSRRHSFTCLIQVIKDDQQKELEGKILVWKFGKKIWEKIEAEQKPIVGEAHNPFNLLTGKLFALVITEVAGYNNYDQSKFLDKVIPLCIPNEEGKLIPINASTPKEVVFNFLKENSPDLKKYGYREWDQETVDYVNQVIVAVTGQASGLTNFSGVLNNINQSSNSPDNAKSPAPVNTGLGMGITTSDINLSDLDNSEMSTDLPDLNLPDLNTDLGGIGLGGDLSDALSKL
jgi:hypothetical protein